MLLQFHFPFTDSRNFLLQDTGKLNHPAWPAPQVDYEFVRSFGCIRNRKKGGVKGWVGENAICEADRAMRFIRLPTFTDPSPPIRVPFRIGFRRLFFDGMAVGKYEVGMIASAQKNISSIADLLLLFPKEKSLLDIFEKDSIAEIFKYLFNRSSVNKNQGVRLLAHIFDLPIEVSNLSIKSQEIKFINTGKYVSKLYLKSSTKKSFQNHLDLENWWVVSGSPVIFIQCKESEYINFNLPEKEVYLPELPKIKLTCYFFPVMGRNIQIWVVKTNDFSKSNLNVVRTLRLYILRLHAEHESLRTVLRLILQEKIVIFPGSENNEIIQRYLNEATRKISRYEHRIQEKFDDKTNMIGVIARRSTEYIRPGEKESLLSLLAHLDIRKNIFSKVKNYIDDEFRQPIDITINLGDLNMGDIYNAKQVGVQGREAILNTTTFNQVIDSSAEKLDLEKLSEELCRLRSVLKESSQRVEHDIAIGAIASAEEQARKGNREKVFKNLTAAGKWSLDVAQKIGTSVAAKAISIALGLEG
jgi:hypothetical protein